MTQSIDGIRRFPQAPAITIRMLLNHSSGLPDISQLQLDLHCADPTGSVSPDELIAAGIALPRESFAPGKGYRYSSLNTIIVGRILEKVTGQSFNDLITERLIVPLGSSSDQARHGWQARAAVQPWLYRLLPEPPAAHRYVGVAADFLRRGRARLDDWPTCMAGVSRSAKGSASRRRFARRGLTTNSASASSVMPTAAG